MIDLRSDTVTSPTPEMRRAMARAEVGDDVLGEDPTVRRLEEISADRMGKEAAVFVPSGTMANLAAVLTHCSRGEEALMGDLSHTVLYEAGGASVLGGISVRTLANKADGTIPLKSVLEGIRPEDVHQPRTRLLCLENTHNMCGGQPLTAPYTSAVAHIARQKGISIHLDGARIFNAAAALGTKPAVLSAEADSVGFCLSKGLGAPAGSVLCGSRPFISAARRWRKMLGGGMRQSGVLAAAGIIAVEKMSRRLGEDHENARLLARGIEDIPGLKISNPVKTNIVFFEVEKSGVNPFRLAESLNARGVGVLCLGSGRLRAVTHLDVAEKDVRRAVEIIAAVMGAGSKRLEQRLLQFGGRKGGRVVPH
jgi:threonine aldolase